MRQKNKWTHKGLPISYHQDNKEKIMIYIITDGELVKIGKSKNVFNRVKSLQTGNGRRLRVLHIFSGGYSQETKMHKEFKDYRTETANEWFKIPDIDKKLMSLGYGLKGSRIKAKKINDSIPVVKKDFLGVDKKERKLDVRDRRSRMFEDIKNQIETSNKMISYAPLVKKYQFTKDEITFFVRSAKLSKGVFDHNKMIAERKI